MDGYSHILLNLLNKLHTYNIITLGSKSIDIHMSNNDSIDEETKRILAEVESDAQSGSDDSKESNKNKGKTWKKKNDKGVEYETNDLETPDSEW